MEIATYIGITIADFWNMTPHELSVSFKSFSKRKNDEVSEYKIKLENERKMLVLQAYQISNWVWKRPGKAELEKILEGEKEKKKAMTDDEMLKQVMVLNKLFGGEVKENGTRQ